MDFSTKVALVTGAARGIGKGCAEELLKCGIKGITIADVNLALGEETAREFNNTFGNGKVIFIQADVTSIKSFENAFKKTIDNFGNIDIVINNAGVLNEINWEKSIQVNMIGTINGILLAIEKYLPKYKSGDKAYVVNISSIAAIDPIQFCPIYTATKQDGIHMMALCPSKTETPMGNYLTDVVKYLDLFEEVQPHFESTLQNVSAVGEALIKAITSSESGSAWLVENGRPYKINFPSLEKLIAID